MKKLQDIFRCCTNYIWLAHGLEVMYAERLKEEVPKYWKGNLDLFIGDISFPKKKNAHTILEEKLRAGKDLTKLVKEFGWMRSRDGFADPFTVEDLKELKEKIGNAPQIKKIKIPKEIKNLVEEVRELVFFRTYRTDILYELLFLARPILKKFGEALGFEFNEMRNYRMDDLINGVIKKYPEVVTAAQYGSDYAFFDENVVEEEKNISEEIKGTIAFTGMAKGVVKIVMSVKDLSKVKDGDIMVTNMTTPNYLVAMKRAVAFVTDEGGITCHAAIVAREMKKPCIIGTKIATKIFKNGDLIEIDTNNGLIKKLN
jgi:phosphohistidine swiveling domain-containing protein